LRMMSFDRSKEEWINSFSKNCCYLIHHREVFDALWDKKHAEEGGGAEDSDTNSESNTTEATG
jgi:hypothetical protein